METLQKDRCLTLSLSAEELQSMEQVAASLELSSEALCRRAIEQYVQFWVKTLDELNAPIDPSNPESLSMAEVNQLVKEMRREVAEQKAA